MQIQRCDGEAGTGEVVVEFFGPFRSYGRNVHIVCVEELSFEELVSLLEARLGPGFREKAEKKTTTFIHNKNVIAPGARNEIRIRPGDRVVFALLLGGG